MKVQYFPTLPFDDLSVLTRMALSSDGILNLHSILTTLDPPSLR